MQNVNQSQRFHNQINGIIYNALEEMCRGLHTLSDTHPSLEEEEEVSSQSVQPSSIATNVDGGIPEDSLDGIVTSVDSISQCTSNVAKSEPMSIDCPTPIKSSEIHPLCESEISSMDCDPVNDVNVKQMNAEDSTSTTVKLACTSDITISDRTVIDTNIADGSTCAKLTTSSDLTSKHELDHPPLSSVEINSSENFDKESSLGIPNIESGQVSSSSNPDKAITYNSSLASPRPLSENNKDRAEKQQAIVNSDCVSDVKSLGDLSRVDVVRDDCSDSAMTLQSSSNETSEDSKLITKHEQVDVSASSSVQASSILDNQQPSTQITNQYVKKSVSPSTIMETPKIEDELSISIEHSINSSAELENPKQNEDESNILLEHCGSSTQIEMPKQDYDASGISLISTMPILDCVTLPASIPSSTVSISKISPSNEQVTNMPSPTSSSHSSTLSGQLIIDLDFDNKPLISLPIEQTISSSTGDLTCEQTAIMSTTSATTTASVLTTKTETTTITSMTSTPTTTSTITSTLPSTTTNADYVDDASYPAFEFSLSPTNSNSLSYTEELTAMNNFLSYNPVYDSFAQTSVCKYTTYILFICYLMSLNRTIYVNYVNIILFIYNPYYRVTES